MTDDETQIRTLIEHWAKAVHEGVVGDREPPQRDRGDQEAEVT